MNIPFKSIVGIQSASFYNFLNTGSSTPEHLATTAGWLRQWETWEVLKYSNTGSTDDIRFGDIVGFKNNVFNVYLSGHPGGNNATTQPNLQDAERWKLIKPGDASSTQPITTSDEIILQQVNSSKYVDVQGGGIQTSIPLSATADQYYRLVITTIIA